MQIFLICCFHQLKIIRYKEVIERHKILERIIETIKCIGKNSISQRSHRNETSYFLENDRLVSHGNFLEILCLLSKFEDVLRNHIENVISKSKKKTRVKRYDFRKRKSYYFYIQNYYYSYIIQIIKSLIQEKIVADIKEAGIHSIQIDSTYSRYIS